MSRVFYNEIEPFAVAWLEQLQAAGEIERGTLDARSIVDVLPVDLDGVTRAHFFAGIAGWELALRLAEWPDDLEVWTGSCPCQPFSSAGHGKGFSDERHLWPEWFRLIRECRPNFVIGEQVASKDGLAWLDVVCTDLESAGYAVGAIDSCAAGVGAPHLRQRLYFVAYTDEARQRLVGRQGLPADGNAPRRDHADGRGPARGLGDASGARSGRDGGAVPRAEGDRRPDGRLAHELELAGDVGGVADRECVGPQGGLDGLRGEGTPPDARGSTNSRGPDNLGDTADEGPQGRVREPHEGRQGSIERGPTNGFWSDAVWIPCTDGKYRAAEPGAFPLASGIPNRVGTLRGAGNAIVVPLAVEFIKAAREAIGV